MNKGNRLKMYFFTVLLGVLCISTPTFAKQKGINYKKEFPKCFHESIKEQRLDVNGDGRLSQKEINAVESLTVMETHISEKYYSLEKIAVFKNLKHVTVKSCHVKNLKPLYSLKRMKTLEIGSWLEIKDKNVDFSKFKQLQSLKVSYAIVGENGKIIDLRKNTKLKRVMIQSVQATVYLQDREYNFGELDRPEFDVYFCKGSQKSKAEFFYKRTPALDKKGEVIQGAYLQDRLYVANNKKYVIKEFDMSSVKNGKTLKKVLRNKKVRWKCADKTVKIKRGEITFTKPGVYTLLGNTQKKRYVFEVYVENRQLKVMPKNIKKIRIRGNKRGIDITDENIIKEIYSQINACNYQFDDSMMAKNQTQEATYSVIVWGIDGTEIERFQLSEDVIYRYLICYRGTEEETVRLTEFIRNIYEERS